MKIFALRNSVALIALAVTASGCSMFEGKKIDYKSAGTLADAGSAAGSGDACR